MEDPLLSLFCGGVAGAVSRTVVSPIERVKVLFQVQTTTRGTYRAGTLATVRRIYQEEGPRGLFRGNGVNCLRIVPYTAIQYTVYEQLRETITKDIRQLNTVEKLFCGLIGGIASVGGTYPLDLLKTRLSVLTAQGLHGSSNSGKDITLWGNMKSVYRHEGGIRGLYRGFVPTVLGVAPYVSLNFALFEQLREWTGATSTPSVLLLGGLAGGISQTIVHPLDVLRRRYQVAALHGPHEMALLGSVASALANTARNEGFRGLFRGWGANMCKIVPSMAVQWAVYEQLRTALSK
jgi:solute carrier family 25 phosphate transporter 23/24/25/41